MSTLKQIADVAGVSTGSVSAVLNGKAKQRRIAPETCARIEEIAERMNYQHNALARSLRAGKSNLLGVVGHSYPTYHVHRTAEAARVLINAGYQITMQDLAWRPQQEAMLLQELLGLQVQGLYIESGAAQQDANDEAQCLLHQQAKRGFPMVRLDHQKGLPIDVVAVDREQGAYMATCHLLELGHRHLVYAVDDSQAPFLQARLSGFQRALKEWGISESAVQFVRPHVLSSDGWSTEHRAGQKCMAEVLEMTPRPTAMLAANDFVAMGAISMAMEAGLCVPDDIAVIGFTGYLEAQLGAVPLTTVAYPFESMARHAAQMLLERVGGRQGKPRVVTLVPELVIRRSCGAQAGMSYQDLLDDGRKDGFNQNFEPLTAVQKKAMAV